MAKKAESTSAGESGMSEAMGAIPVDDSSAATSHPSRRTAAVWATVALAVALVSCTVALIAGQQRSLSNGDPADIVALDAANFDVAPLAPRVLASQTALPAFAQAGASQQTTAIGSSASSAATQSSFASASQQASSADSSASGLSAAGAMSTGSHASPTSASSDVNHASDSSSSSASTASSPNVQDASSSSSSPALFPAPSFVEGPGFAVTDSRRVWGDATDIDLFASSYLNAAGDATVASSDGSKVIAPGTSGAYTFALRNTGTVPLDCRVWVEVAQDADGMDIPLKLTLTGDGSSQEGLSASAALASHASAVYTLAWEWPFEADDEGDTALGQTAASKPLTYTVTVHTQASADVDASLAPGAGRPGAANAVPKTADLTFDVSTTATFALAGVALLLMGAGILRRSRCCGAAPATGRATEGSSDAAALAPMSPTTQNEDVR